ncbi:hypothetical protein PSACC_00382 [Paramicrosporidium saccamoebae]|uniref:Peptidase M48 domain-containing protein n=1 Tax=Paramicrosporidium saccamoebae TaxID=1246581 RepID=A0A2H9TPR1_9FUNG|nr:hypothetical protein PSACC_00382 [Paramicrosporidium saccamoebae]
MATDLSLLPDAAAAKRWLPSKDQAKKIFYAPLLVSLVIQCCAIAFQTAHLIMYARSNPTMGTRESVGMMLTLTLFPAGLLTLGCYSMSFKKQWIPRLWKRANEGRFANGSLLVRSVDFTVFWSALISLNLFNYIHLAMSIKGLLLLFAEYFLSIVGSVFLAICLLKLNAKKSRHVACFWFCLVTIVTTLVDWERGFLPIEFLPRLKEDKNTKPLFKLARQDYFDTKQIYEGERLNNAFYTRSLLREKIIIGDYLLEGNTPSSVTAVMAHELGHRFNNDLTVRLYGILLSQTFWNVVMFYIILPSPEVYAAFGFDTEPIVAAIALRETFHSLYSLALTPLSNLWSQHVELRADRFAAEMGYGESLIKALEEISFHKTGNWLYEAVYCSHPSNERRIAAIRKQMAQMR